MKPLSANELIAENGGGNLQRHFWDLWGLHSGEQLGNNDSQ